ncbi:TorF family putative porin [Thiospirillum jenense]|uniref:Uncharacterized protein n=1 Tax=Thiospirillum jenense TaxID=1653858 RepID=A0A839HF27_9GAMM|nr:TorF family putative porin [Thiospirillum jenense]MBB1126710.1 hypothetical protein [Thiospirillum jenense]
MSELSNKTRLSVTVCAITALGGTSSALAADPWSASANIGAVSNYIWRGVTQTDDQAAVQGGVDVAHESGFHAGTWVSNVDFGPGSATYELDVTAGYDFQFGNEDMSLGLSTIYVAYPDSDPDDDFWEMAVTGGYKWFSAGIHYTVWGGDDTEDAIYTDGDIYYNLAVDLPLPKSFSIGAFAGYYDFTNELPVNELETDSVDYTHWGVKLSKDASEFGTFSLTYEQTDGSDAEFWNDEAKVWVGWNKTF